MIYDKFKKQRDTKLTNEQAVLNYLNKEPKRFKDLINETGISAMGLTNILKRLLSEGKIERTLHKDKEAYSLTKKGQDYLKGMWMILYEIYEMQNRKTNYESNYFSENDIKYSLLRDIESPQINYRNFIDLVFSEYRELILKSIKEKYIKENEDNTYSLINKEELKGKHIITFEIDFDLIRKNIEDSLTSVSMDSKAESEIFTPIKDAIKEDKRNLYRHILLKEERKPILEQESDREDDPQ
jgi:DNA-binding HxlR family transcriptional regulator